MAYGAAARSVSNFDRLIDRELEEGGDGGGKQRVVANADWLVDCLDFFMLRFVGVFSIRAPRV